MLSSEAVITQELLVKVIAAGHSRVPVYEGDNKQVRYGNAGGGSCRRAVAVAAAAVLLLEAGGHIMPHYAMLRGRHLCLLLRLCGCLCRPSWG